MGQFTAFAADLSKPVGRVRPRMADPCRIREREILPPGLAGCAAASRRGILPAGVARRFPALRWIPPEWRRQGRGSGTPNPGIPRCTYALRAGRDTVVEIHLSSEEAETVRKIAKFQGTGVTDLIHKWTVEQTYLIQQKRNTV